LETIYVGSDTGKIHGLDKDDGKDNKQSCTKFFSFFMDDFIYWWFDTIFIVGK
jgi:hypothetical protein